ncbi:hypothetical protein GIY62_16100 [Burkholderia plantarii]|uniref:hypothetical protein n=1 Tax=Burkholderia plantarii TaxID=41899 RepID=UPI00272C58C7|nr:hypothetical protein [Burkholderia plantarii]WLE58625.1 hypothetical protein GIY62_16100 [Burkholderia plantarii]
MNAGDVERYPTAADGAAIGRRYATSCPGAGGRAVPAGAIERHRPLARRPPANRAVPGMAHAAVSLQLTVRHLQADTTQAPRIGHGSRGCRIGRISQRGAVDPVHETGILLFRFRHLLREFRYRDPVLFPDSENHVTAVIFRGRVFESRLLESFRSLL